MKNKVKNIIKNIILILMAVLFILCISMNLQQIKENTNWSIYYKTLEVSDHYSDFGVEGTTSAGVARVVKEYYIVLDNKYTIQVSESLYNSIVDSGSIECSLLDNGSNIPAIIPYKIELEEYSYPELYQLYYDCPHMVE